MNREMPYNFTPPYNNNDFNNYNERLNNIEKKLKMLEKKVEILENNKVYPTMPYNIPNFPNNYMM